MNFAGNDLEQYCKFLGALFLEKYAQVAGADLGVKIRTRLSMESGVRAVGTGHGDGASRNRSRGIVEAASGVRGFKLLRLGGSAFRGFVRDEYTTLPDLHNRPLHMWLDLEWSYADPDAAFSCGAVTARVRQIVREVFASFESGSIQQVIYQMGTKMLAYIPAISEMRLEANNRTWDTIAERGDELGVYMDARPPYGCLGLTLKRTDL